MQHAGLWTVSRLAGAGVRGRFYREGESVMTSETQYHKLTGFKARGKARYRLLLDYGYGPDKWVEHCGAQTIEAIRRKRRQLPQWSADKVIILDLKVPDDEF